MTSHIPTLRKSNWVASDIFGDHMLIVSKVIRYLRVNVSTKARGKGTKREKSKEREKRKKESDLDLYLAFGLVYFCKLMFRKIQVILLLATFHFL